MLGVALGIRTIQTQLPDLVYALLSGLNAATVGLIALAAVQLSERGIYNQMSRFIICATGSVGILYQGSQNIFNFLNRNSSLVLPRAHGNIWDFYGNIRHWHSSPICQKATQQVAQTAGGAG